MGRVGWVGAAVLLVGCGSGELPVESLASAEEAAEPQSLAPPVLDLDESARPSLSFDHLPTRWVRRIEAPVVHMKRSDLEFVRALPSGDFYAVGQYLGTID